MNVRQNIKQGTGIGSLRGNAILHKQFRKGFINKVTLSKKLKWVRDEPGGI